MQQYARFVAQVITEELGIHVVINVGNCDDDSAEPQNDRIARIFLWHARRTGCEYEDMGGILFLELAEAGYAGQTITSRRLHGVLSRIRMQALRDARKAVKITKVAIEDPRHALPECNQELMIADMAEQLDPVSLLIALALLEGRPKSEIALDFGMSRATFYRHHGKLRRQLASLLNPGEHNTEESDG